MSPIPLVPEKVETITMACCALHNFHNFLRKKTSSRHIYTPPSSMDREDPSTHSVLPGDWRHDQQSCLKPLSKGSNRHSTEAKEIREQFCNYFISKYHGKQT